MKCGVLSIAHSSVLAKLTHLDVGCCGADESDIVVLANSCLTFVNLYNCGIGAVTATLLRNGCPNLVHLDFCHNMLGWEGAKVLAESEYSSKLTYFNISSNDLGDEGLRFVAESPHFRSLRHLDLTCNHNTKGGSGVFARSCSSNFPRLAILDVAGNAFDLAAFVNSEHPFVHLEELMLINCQLSEAEIELMARSSSFPAMKRLDLDANISENEERLRNLFASNPSFSQLTCISL